MGERHGASSAWVFARAVGRVRALCAGVTVVAMTAVAATAQVAPAAAAGPVIADGSITCTTVTGSMKISPPLRPGGTSPATITAKLSLSGCNNQAGNTNVGSTKVTATATLTAHATNSDCSAWNTGGPVEGTVRWKGTLPVTNIADTVLNAPVYSPGEDGSAGIPGSHLTDPTAAGSYAGASAAAMYSALTAAEIADACTAAHHLKTMPLGSGLMRFGPAPAAPVFTSAASTTFGEGDEGSFTVSVSDEKKVHLVRSGDLPAGVRFVANEDNATATISGTPEIGSAGVYSLTLTAADANSQVAQQAYTLNVDAIAPARVVVEGLSPENAGEGSTVTITGHRLNHASQVTFGSTDASFTVVNGSKIKATVPVGIDAGPIPVIVTTPNGPSVTVSGVAFAVIRPPRAPYIEKVLPQGLALLTTWAPSETLEFVTGYTLSTQVAAGYAGPVPGGCGTVANTPAPGTDTSALVTGVCAGVPYTISLTATNQVGTSPSSVLSNPAVPLAAQVPQPPLINAVFRRSNALFVSWVAPAQDGGLPIGGYTLTAKSKNATVEVSAAPGATDAMITGLTNNTNYSLSLTASSEAGHSEAATAAAKPSATVKPAAPAGLLVVPDGNGNIDASWSPPIDEGSQAVESYTVTATPSKGGATDGASAAAAISVTLPASTTSYSFTTLAAATFYDFSVVAATPVGNSKPMLTSSAVSPTIALADNASVLSQASSDEIVSNDGGKLVFPPRTPPNDVAALVPGDTFVAPASTAAPQGLLVTVQSVSTDAAGHYVVDTVPAAFSDAFDDVSFSVTGIPPAAAPAIVQATVPGVRGANPSAIPGDPTFNFNLSQGDSSSRARCPSCRVSR